MGRWVCDDPEAQSILDEYFNKLPPDVQYKRTGPPGKQNDPVNHPSHYTQGSVECIDAMEAAFGKEELAIYCKIAAFKYIWRCEHKDGVKQDIEKARWYIEKVLELIEKE